ncbi:head-tail joining protein [Marinobacter sp. DS40M6]|uniref:head-tail joining protein n=1 Tax=Marinobacter sp. DS40M6 TaxID=1597776 RepID=UPI0023590D9F|nr:hypothetical protein [Marinobacter sp. DS40M6]MDC8455336.1 hypothetical protein [Marinobacter sp. DS40M6]
MSKFDSMAGRLESAIDDQFGDAGLYDDGTNPPFEVRVIIDLQVEQRQAFESNLPTHRDELEIRKVYVARPKRGDKVVVGSATWVFDGLITDDGYVTRHWVYGSES